jgi:GT2 family glycosyltransferase
MSNRDGSRPRVCVSASEIPTARALADAGLDVTVLDLGRADRRGLPQGARVAGLPPSPVRLRGPACQTRSYQVYQWLKEEAFDLAVFPLSQGLLFYAAMGRQTGAALEGTRLVVVADRPTLCSQKANSPWPDDPVLLELDFMERQAVERADALASSDAVADEWLSANGWKRPAVAIKSAADLAAFAAQPAEAVGPPPRTPMATVCLIHYNRPALLAQAIQSLRDQTYAPYEVVLVDSGSTTPESIRFLDSIEPEFAARGWRVVRQENRWAGAAYNAAARPARGEYLLFMDDDNYAKPDELAAMVRAAERTAADVVVCCMDIFHGDEAPAAGLQPFRRHLFLGGCATGGVFRNCLSDTNAMVRRETFERLGGFTEVQGVGQDDWEFYAWAAVQGSRYAVVPEALYWYRGSGRRLSDNAAANVEAVERRHLRPYIKSIEPTLADAIPLACGMKARLDSPAHRAASALESVCRGRPRARRFLDWCARRLAAVLRQRS